MPFSVTVTACDILNNPILVYNGTATLSAAGQAGVLSVSPTTITFVNGTWSGNVTVNAVDPTVSLTLNNGGGGPCTSNVFVMQPGPVAKFQWSTICQSAVCERALFDHDYGRGRQRLQGHVASTARPRSAGRSARLRREWCWVSPRPTRLTRIDIPYTLGYSFTPRRRFTVTNVLHYFGNVVLIWTAGGTLLASQTFAAAGGSWADTPLTTPVQLTAGTTFIVAVYDAAGPILYEWSSTSHTSPLGTLGQDYGLQGDGFPTGV